MNINEVEYKVKIVKDDTKAKPSSEDSEYIPQGFQSLKKWIEEKRAWERGERTLNIIRVKFE